MIIKIHQEEDLPLFKIILSINTTMKSSKIKVELIMKHLHQAQPEGVKGRI
jgi:hypothetical protein